MVAGRARPGLSPLPRHGGASGHGSDGLAVDGVAANRRAAACRPRPRWLLLLLLRHCRQACSAVAGCHHRGTVGQRGSHRVAADCQLLLARCRRRALLRVLRLLVLRASRRLQPLLQADAPRAEARLGQALLAQLLLQRLQRALQLGHLQRQRGQTQAGLSSGEKQAGEDERMQRYSKP